MRINKRLILALPVATIGTDRAGCQCQDEGASREDGLFASRKEWETSPAESSFIPREIQTVKHTKTYKYTIVHIQVLQVHTCIQYVREGEQERLEDPEDGAESWTHTLTTG